MEPLCIKCKGKGLCGRPCKIQARFASKMPKIKTHFSGSTPPEIFVGRANYPNVFSGILSPNEKGDTQQMSSPELWIKNNLPIDKILELRGSLIYARSITNIKTTNKIKQLTQELALSHKPVSTEIHLTKKPTFQFHPSKIFSIMTNPAPLKSVKLEENPKVHQKVDYLVSDYDVKSTTALKELYKSKIKTSHLQKLLSAGLLGIKSNRKMVPTRWSITAVDDTLGKQLLEKIKHYQELTHIELFHHTYNGNHFEVLLLPNSFSFEVIEVSVKGNLWGGEDKDYFSQDYESIFGRKTYASNVVGAYYTDRLACLEYLEKIKKQATILVMHEEWPEYYAPLGVGIIRESLRKMFQTSQPEKPQTIQQAFQFIKDRARISINEYQSRSYLLNNYGKQKSLSSFI